MSEEDVSKGQRWSSEIASALDATGQGLICVTVDNFREPWLNFEAGALAKSLADSRVRPVLLDVQAHEVEGPLAQFQGTVVTDQEDMRRLVTSLNEVLETPLETSRLSRSFDRAWPDFIASVEDLRAASGSTSIAKRSTEELLAEVVDRVRTIERAVVAGAETTRITRTPFDHSFSVGQSVRHETFGVGVVVATAGDGDTSEVTVTFNPNIGTKRLLARYAPLAPIDEPPF